MLLSSVKTVLESKYKFYETIEVLLGKSLERQEFLDIHIMLNV